MSHVMCVLHELANRFSISFHIWKLISVQSEKLTKFFFSVARVIQTPVKLSEGKIFLWPFDTCM